MLRAIHYQAPKSLSNYCGRGGDRCKLTTTAIQVTCRLCQKQMVKWGHLSELPPVPEKRSKGRPKKEGGRNRISVDLTDEAFDRYRTIQGNKGDALSEIILKSIPSPDYKVL